MSTEKHHISTYTSHGVVLTALLSLTALSVAIAELHLGALSVAVALLVASIKGTTVLTYFMHLKYESLFFKIMVSGVFVMYILVIIFLFFDYLFR
jgi:cytochrome c oxidase subunit 4